MLEQEAQEHILAIQETVALCNKEINEIIELIVSCFQSGHKVLLCGNGGSAADAQHVAAEFVNRFRLDRPPLPAIALTTDSSVLTSIGNDSDFGYVFSRQVEALGVNGDILIGISTSGKSMNVVHAAFTAKSKELKTILFTGYKKYRSYDYCLSIPSSDTARIQECHEFVFHVICREVENRLFGG